MSRSITRPALVADTVAAPPGGRRAARAKDRSLVQLRRMQWAVRGALLLGVAASVSANVLHAQDNLIAQFIAAWPPLALLLTVELIARVPVYRRALAVVRLLATACIAGIAAYVSYFHMAAVVSRYGEHQPNPYLLPISVDGLIVVASVSLVELAGRIHTRESQPHSRRADPPAPDEPPRSATELVSAEPPAAVARYNGHAATGSTAPERPSRTARPPAEPPTPTTATSPSPTPVPVSAVAETPIPVPATPPSPPITAPPHTEPAPPEPPAAEHDDPEGDGDSDIDPELAALLPAARAARDALQRDGRGLTRDSLAAQLRRDGHTIRTSRVSALLNLLRSDEPTTANGRRS